jgi:glycosyltransferase involved in cell wall biosynthesis
MKIAFLYQPINTMSLTDREGSIEIWTYEVARRLARHCEVIVYAKKSHDQKKFEYNQGVQYRRISATADEKFDFMASGIDKRLSRLINLKRPLYASSSYYLTYALQAAKDLRSEKCDIVHIHTFSQFVPIIRALNPKIRIVLHMQCEWLTQLDRKMIESRLKKTDLVIGCSDYITEKIRRCFPQFAKRCQTVYNGVDVNYFAKENGNNTPKKNGIKRLLFVGRVSPEKGVHVLLDAFQKVLKPYPQTQLKIVGPHGNLPFQFHLALSDDPKDSEWKSFYSGNYVSHLRSKLSSSVTSHVSFTGSVPHRQLISFYKDADVFVFPSVWNEPFGMPIVEAMAAGVPVVSTRGGGIPEIVVDGKTGLLVERGDASALAEAILRLLSNENLREAIIRDAHERAVELLSWEKIVENLLYHYSNLGPFK